MQISSLSQQVGATTGLLGRAPQVDASQTVLVSSCGAGDGHAAEERLRKRVGRELHDGPAQRLALAGYVLDRLIQAQADDQERVADARLARELIDEAVREMRAVIHRLRSAPPPDPAPSATGPLRALVADWAPAEPDLAVEIDQLSGVRLTPEVEVAVVGIAREALRNARKHARAHSIRLEVRRDEAGVEVTVIDDGVGCDGQCQPGHFGLEQIRELAEETGGSLTIGSMVSSGTAVRARIPVAPTDTGRLGPLPAGARRDLAAGEHEDPRGSGGAPGRLAEQGRR